MAAVVCLKRAITTMEKVGYFLVLSQFFLMDIVNSEFKEYCSREDFTPRCGSGEVIVMTHAVYGRMRQGRCVRSSTGIGCQSDVLRMLDDLCSNKEHCEVGVHTDLSVAKSSCPEDMLRYLEADYMCEKVVDIGNSQCRSASSKVEVSTSLSISSEKLSYAGCGSSTLHFAAKPGQTLNISMVDLTWNPLHDSARSCVNYFELKDPLLTKSLPVCAGSVRKRHIMTSNHSELSLVFHLQDPDHQRFIVKLEAIGCGDITPPEGTWVQRDGDETTLGCHSGKHTWTLRCEHNQWVGAVGSCGTGFVIQKAVVQPDDNSWSIAPGMVVFAACSLLLLLASSLFTIGVCIYTHRPRDNPGVNYSQQPRTVHNQPLLQYGGSSKRNMPPPEPHPPQICLPVKAPAPNSFQNDEAFQNKHMTYNQNQQEYINTTDSTYSDSVKYYVLENVNG